MTKKIEPSLIITVTPAGVTAVTIPYRTLAEQKAGQELQAKCATMISLLSQVARGVAQEIAPLAPAPSLDKLIQPADKTTFATSQSHHPRE